MTVSKKGVRAARQATTSIPIISGGPMFYRTDCLDQWRRVTIYVDKILKGAKPVELPVQQPRKLEVVVNLKTAQDLDLTIPPAILLHADQIIRYAS